MSKQLTAEERAFAYLQETEYALIHRVANKAGQLVGRVKNVNKELKGQSQAVADTFKSGKKDGDTKSANQVAMKAAMKSNSSKFDTEKLRDAAVKKGKTLAMHKTVGATAGGAVIGGALGAGIGHLATSKSRKRVAFLKSKGDSLSNKERAELVAKQAKVKNAKIIGGAVGAVAGGAGGYVLGSKAGKKAKLKTLKGYNSKKTAAMNQHNEATKDKDGKGVLDKIADRVAARSAKPKRGSKKK